MNEFLAALPWRLAALSALIVGSVGITVGGLDAWAGLERAGIAFAAFFALGAAGCKTLLISQQAAGKGSKRDLGASAGESPSA